jgi:hypothetical protein
MEIIFLAKGIKAVKRDISNKSSIDAQAERFRIDMLAKYDLLFKKTPHTIRIKY